MKTVAIALFFACVVGSSLAQNCPARKIRAFHKCLQDSQKKAEGNGKAKFEALKTKLDACYTDNGCTPPARGQRGQGGASGGASGESQSDNGANRACGKALGDAFKRKFQDCVKQAVPGAIFPAKDDHRDGPRGGPGGFNRRDENLEGCANKQAVRDCKRALFNSSRPSDAEQRAYFKAHCDAKAVCEGPLEAACPGRLDQFMKAACQCGQQLRQQADQIRSSVRACDGVQEPKGQRPQGQQRQETCDNKNYCQLGYDAFVRDHPQGGDWFHQ